MNSVDQTEHGGGTVLRSVDPRGIGTVTLNRPARNNAYNGDVIQGLIDAFTALATDDTVRVVVLRGNGKHFQAGADLSWLKEIGTLSPEENVAVSRRTAAAIRGLTEFPKPTIALVHGGCFGGGTGMVAACDIVVASRDAVFAITEARWGVMAGIIVPHLNAAIGVREVRRWALTCERFDATQAHALGLVHQLCDEGSLDAAAAPIIDGLLMSAPDALAQTKRRALLEAGLVLDDAHFEALVLEHAAKRQSDEAAEGLASFLEKRAPSWYPDAPASI
jgi:methylglutaconyl-CoA hydratase